MDAPSIAAVRTAQADATGLQWYEHWLARAVTASGALAGMVVLPARPRSSGDATVAALVPADSELAAALYAAGRHALEQPERSIATVPGRTEQVVAWPVAAAGSVLGAAAFVLPAIDEERLAAHVDGIELQTGALEAHLVRGEAARLTETHARQSFVLDGVDAVLGETRFDRAALAFVNFIARRFGVERAVLGLVRGGEIEIECQSDTSHYAAKVNTMRLTRAAMQEAADQAETVSAPAVAEGGPVDRAHVALAENIGRVSVASVPLVDGGLRCYAVLLVERAASAPFSPPELRRLEALGHVVGLLLEDRRRSQQPLHRLLAESLRRLVETFLRPGHLRRKVALLIVGTAAVVLSFAKGDFRPGGEVVLEGEEMRTIVAPFDGFLESASAKAGDELLAGDELATLDTRELRLERLRWLADEARAARQYEDALARQDRSQVQIHAAEVERAKAELGLLDYKIARARATAPFAATVVDGDLSQRIGSAVRQGDRLFELAPLQRYRIALFVDEFTIGEVAVGQRGTAVLSALPGRELAIEIARIIPAAEVRDGETVFRVEAALLDEAGEELRPGLVGAGRVLVDRRLLIDIWTRALRNWLRLQWWRL